MTKWLENKINAAIVDALKKVDSSIVSCEKCGCLVYRKNAIQSKSVIEKKREIDYLISSLWWDICGPPATETIREVYYCKIHAPKAKTK